MVDDEIDYMHPNGKPPAHFTTSADNDDGKPDPKSLQIALQEADGHSMNKPDSFLHPDSTSGAIPGSIPEPSSESAFDSSNDST